MTRRRAPVVSDDDGSVSDDDHIDRRPTRRRHHLISHDTPPRRRPTRVFLYPPPLRANLSPGTDVHTRRTTGDTTRPTDRPPRDLNVGQLGTPVRPTAHRTIHPSRTTSPHSSLTPTSSPPRPRGRRSRARWIGTPRVVGRARARVVSSRIASEDSFARACVREFGSGLAPRAREGRESGDANDERG